MRLTGFRHNLRCRTQGNCLEAGRDHETGARETGDLEKHAPPPIPSRNASPAILEGSSGRFRSCAIPTQDTEDLIARQDGRPKAKALKFKSERLRGCNASGF